MVIRIRKMRTVSLMVAKPDTRAVLFLSEKTYAAAFQALDSPPGS
jgi:hypothetical protein